MYAFFFARPAWAIVIGLSITAAWPFSQAGPIQALGEHNRDQIILNAQRVLELDRRINELELRQIAASTGQQAQEVKLALIESRFRDLEGKLDIITRLLVGLAIGLLGKFAYDVLGYGSTEVRRVRRKKPASTDAD